MALKTLTIARSQAGGRYADVIDAAEALAERYGSAPNALAHMARGSPLYGEAMKSAESARDGGGGAATPPGPGPSA